MCRPMYYFYVFVLIAVFSLYCEGSLISLVNYVYTLMAARATIPPVVYLIGAYVDISRSKVFNIQAHVLGLHHYFHTLLLT